MSKVCCQGAMHVVILLGIVAIKRQKLTPPIPLYICLNLLVLSWYAGLLFDYMTLKFLLSKEVLS